jgi:hypothetical protein
MNEKDSFEKKNSDYFNDNNSENFETKEQTTKNEQDDENEESNEIKNIDLIKSISQILETILNNNKCQKKYKKTTKRQRKIPFSTNIIPKISIEDYLLRIQACSNMEKNTLITGLIYIDRLCQETNITLTYYNIHRIIFTSILLSIKYNEDKYYKDRYYADIAGVSIKELNYLEYIYVKMIHFQLYVNDKIFKRYKLYLDNFNY